VLEWDAKAFFLDSAHPPLTLQVNRSTGLATIANQDDAAAALSAYTIASAGGQLSPAGWNSLADQTTPGWSEIQAVATSLSESSAGDPLIVGASDGTASLGCAFAGKPIAFRVDAPTDLTFQYTADGELRTGKVEYTGQSLNNLTVLVDPVTGLARLENTSPFAVAIDAYTISSASQSLAPGEWQSLDEQDAANGTWAEANNSPARISELQSAGNTPLEPGDSFEMGQLFNADGQQDLVFDFLLAGASTSLRGVVYYTNVRLPGDYNDDGIVDAADYSVWRDSLNQAVERGTGADGNRDGLVTSADYELWKSSFGKRLAAASGGALASVPEPGTLSIVLLVALGALSFRYR
jgi:Dockerin type I domain